jgi:hypothetical protein
MSSAARVEIIYLRHSRACGNPLLHHRVAKPNQQKLGGLRILCNRSWNLSPSQVGGYTDGKTTSRFETDKEVLAPGGHGCCRLHSGRRHRVDATCCQSS